ncbi:MAG: N-acyl-D-amino-acid deacylase family protein [Promethearchaeota archaeon]
MEYDIIIKNGKIIDGAGNPWYRGEIGIKNGKIMKIRTKINEPAAKIVDARGLIVSPGFIDIHSHSDLVLPISRTLESTLHQGITTSVVGMCGDGMAPIPPGKEEEFKKIVATMDPALAEMEYPYHTFAEYLDFLQRKKISANLAFLVGYGNIRFAGGQGGENRDATPEEMEAMKGYLREAMEAGAFGMSTGLIYAPQIFAKTEEIIELMKIVAEYNGYYFSHIRGEGENVINAVKEVIEIVEKSGCAGGQIAHHKISGKAFWGRSKETLRLIEEANERGISVTCDQYPYNRGMSDLPTALPGWAREGTKTEILERIRNPEIQARIRKEVEEGLLQGENWIKDERFENIYISSVSKKEWEDVMGKSISEITKMKNFKDDWETFFKLIIENELAVMVTIESMGEEDIRRIMTSRYQMVGTDGFGIPVAFSRGAFHPRCFGTYPRVLGKYVREEKLLTLEQAIRKMTSFPAQRIGIQDRGLLIENSWADIVIFNPDTIRDRATYERPYQTPEGISHVLVNGVVMIKDGKQSKKKPGMIIRRPT